MAMLIDQAGVFLNFHLTKILFWCEWHYLVYIHIVVSVSLYCILNSVCEGGGEGGGGRKAETDLIERCHKVTGILTRHLQSLSLSFCLSLSTNISFSFLFVLPSVFRPFYTCVCSSLKFPVRLLLVIVCF